MIEIYTDGASRGNPGLASYAFIITEDGKEVERKSGYIGKTTNNRAEYKAVIEALERAKGVGAEEVKVYSDSRLVVNQLEGNWKVKSEEIRPLHKKASELMGKFDEVRLVHVSRENEMTKMVDRMCNRKLDERA